MQNIVNKKNNFITDILYVLGTVILSYVIAAFIVTYFKLTLIFSDFFVLPLMVLFFYFNGLLKGLFKIYIGKLIFAYAFLIGIAFALLNIFISGYLYNFNYNLLVGGLQSNIVTYGKEGFFYYFIAIAFTTPIIEELLYRGVITNLLLSYKLNIFVVVLIPTILWVLSHEPSGFVHIVFLLLSGAVSSFLYLKSKSILPCILDHATYNVMVFLLIPFKNIKIMYG